MYIPKISAPHSYRVAKKIVKIKRNSSYLTSACLKKCRPDSVKKFIPGMMLAAQSVMLPIHSPSINKFHVDMSKFKSTVVEIESKKAHSEFNKVHSMVKCVLPNTSRDFVNEIVKTSKDVNCMSEDLTALLFVESKFNPAAKRGSFIGIGQMNQRALNQSVKYAKEHESHENILPAISPEIFSKLTREQQMPYVRNYILAMKDSYIKDKNKILTGGELYALFYTPGRINSKFLTSANDHKTAAYYHSNSNLDFNKDKTITKQDLQQFLDSVRVNNLVFKYE